MELSSDTAKKWIVDNWSKPYSEMALKFNCTVNRINKQIKRWRRAEPHLFPEKRGVARLIPENQTTWRWKDGVLREYHRTPKGFRLVTHLKNRKAPTVDRQYILDNHTKMSMDSIAQHFGVKRDVVKNMISKLRREGFDIPYQRKAQFGDIRIRKVRGKDVEMVKTENGFRLVNSKYKIDSAPKTKKVAEKPSKPVKVRKIPGKTVKRLPQRIQNLSDKKVVYIPELRMKVYVDQHMDEATIRAKYLRKKI